LQFNSCFYISQLQLNEHAQPIWTEMTFNSDQQFTNLGSKTQSQTMRIRNGIVSNDGRKLFLSIMNGSLLEVTEIQPLRWNYHGRPPGGDVSYISDAGNLRPGTLFTVRYAKHMLFMSRREVPFQSTL